MAHSIGYAISRESYRRYKAGEDPMINNNSLLNDGILDEESDYLVVSCEEWDHIISEHKYDRSVPVGMVNIVLRVGSDEIIKRFSVPASEELFGLIKIVMFTVSMSEEEFKESYTYSTEPEIGLNEKLVRCESATLTITLNKKEKRVEKTLPVSSTLEECHPVEFRNVGLTCYMNTALQVLLGVGELSGAIEKMSTEEIEKYARRKDTAKGYSREKCGDLLNAYRELIRTVRKRGDCLLKLKEVKRALGRIDVRYRGCSEEDAGEVFSLILNNFNYLFEKTGYASLIPDLFMYKAESIRVFTKDTKEVCREVKPLYTSFVLNGSFGSEGGPHFHTLVIHKDQLVLTGLCIYEREKSSIGSVKKRVSEIFRIEPEKILAILVEDGRVIRASDQREFTTRKNLLEQPIFYITDEDPEDVEFLFISYTAGVEGLSFFTSLFSGFRNVLQLPFLVKKKCNIAQFLEDNLKIRRKTHIPNTVLEIKQNRDRTEECFGSMVIELSNKYWDPSEHLEVIKTRKYEVRDCVHVQCVVSNWETKTVRARAETDKEEFEFAAVEESTKFRAFSKYFCVQLPIGLGRAWKSDKFDRQKLFVEKEGLVLDGVSYSLVGILVHHSFGIGGHYVAFTKRNGVWYHCNDSTITRSSGNEAISTGYPYGLLYRRSDL